MNNLESTRLSDLDIDEICQEVVSNKDLLHADQIDDISLVENIVKTDLIQQMDLYNISSDLSFENKPEDQILSLNLALAEKNKIIFEQETKLNQLNSFVENLMTQLHMYKVQERRNQDLVFRIENENKTLKSRSQLYKAAVLKLNSLIPSRKEMKPIQEKNKFRNVENEKICFNYRKNGYCWRESRCRFQHSSPDPFLWLWE